MAVLVASQLQFEGAELNLQVDGRQKNKSALQRRDAASRVWLCVDQ